MLLKQSALELAAAIRTRQTTSRAVVDAHIAHAQKVNPLINAIVVDRFAAAQRDADAADARIEAAIAAGTIAALPPLLGVPCTIKENFEYIGTPQASGLVSRRHIINDSNAPTVQALLDAGAIPLGVTNTSELCMWMESYNKVYGCTNNPYDATRIVGGSSGGEGAIVGSGASPFGLGADVGGSIRMPAFFNGTFGHKCSPQLVPNEGQFPAPSGNIDDFLSTGPLCRRAEDLEPLLRILAGDRATRLAPVNQVDMAGLRVLSLEPDYLPRASRDMVNARDRAVAALVEAGARHVPVDLPLMKKAFDIWSSMLATAGSEQSFAEMMFGSRNPLVPATELVKLALGRSDHTFPLLMLTLFERVPELTPQRARKIAAQGLELKAQLEELLGDDGVLVCSPYTEAAPPHGKPLFPPFNWVRCALFNALSVPATSVPMGLDGEGLPLGVQVVGAQNHDHLTIACALELERRIGGWVAPWEAQKSWAGAA
jgi:fatty acid amide hydrolase 2